jgi:hypothetical protein
MALPEFDGRGDLPLGIHAATLAEVCTRFGSGLPQRELVTARLLRVYELAKQTEAATLCHLRELCYREASAQ